MKMKKKLFPDCGTLECQRPKTDGASCSHSSQKGENGHSAFKHNEEEPNWSHVCREGKEVGAIQSWKW